MSAIKLVTSKLSPFGHRVEMCLIEKKISYEKVDVDLANKPDWFIQDSPLGKAPIIYGNGRPLFESIAICEYLEEIFTDKKLHPSDPYQKAWNRGWMEFCNGLISAIFALAFVGGLRLFGGTQSTTTNLSQSSVVANGSVDNLNNLNLLDAQNDIKVSSVDDSVVSTAQAELSGTSKLDEVVNANF